MVTRPLFRPQPHYATADLIEAAGRQLLRVDAILLGAVVIAVIMIAGLLLLQSDPAAAHECRTRAYRDMASGVATVRDGGARSGSDSSGCRMRAARLRGFG